MINRLMIRLGQPSPPVKGGFVMPIPSDQLELLSQQINHAHRSAVSEELSRGG